MVALSDAVEKLSAVSKQLNEETDSLNDVIDVVEKALASTRVGVTAWLNQWWIAQQDFDDEQQRSGYWYWLIGYTKIGDDWRIATKTQSSVDLEDGEVFSKDRSAPIPLAKAPRLVRVEAAKYLESLVQELTRRVEGFVANIQQAKKLVQD